jgi:hypothetical protein
LSTLFRNGRPDTPRGFTLGTCRPPATAVNGHVKQSDGTEIDVCTPGANLVVMFRDVRVVADALKAALKTQLLLK